jgi:hypothetical protein
MATTISLQSVQPRKLAAVRRQVAIGNIASAWRPALDHVWEFLRKHPGLRTDGHNIFLYHHPADMSLPMNVDFGVEVTRAFEPAGDVFATDTPAGEAPWPCMSAPTIACPKHMARSTHGRRQTGGYLPANPGKYTATRQTIRQSWKPRLDTF